MKSIYKKLKTKKEKNYEEMDYERNNKWINWKKSNNSIHKKKPLKNETIKIYLIRIWLYVQKKRGGGD